MSPIEENRHAAIAAVTGGLPMAVEDLPPMRYHELAPARALAPYVQSYAEFVVLEAPARPFVHVVVPDGCAHLTYLRPPAPDHAIALGGPRLTSSRYVMTARQLCWDVKLRPHGLGLLGLRPADWFGRVAGLPPELEHLARRLEHALKPCVAGSEARHVLDDALAELLEGATPIDEVVAEAVGMIEESDGQRPIGEVVEGLGIGERQLQRRFRRAVGLTPKQFSRIRRFRACARNLIAERPEAWGRVAVAHGYADQAHLNREFARLAGRSPTRLERYVACIEHGAIRV